MQSFVWHLVGGVLFYLFNICFVTCEIEENKINLVENEFGSIQKNFKSGMFPMLFLS